MGGGGGGGFGGASFHNLHFTHVFPLDEEKISEEKDGDLESESSAYWWFKKFARARRIGSTPSLAETAGAVLVFRASARDVCNHTTVYFIMY